MSDTIDVTMQTEPNTTTSSNQIQNESSNQPSKQSNRPLRPHQTEEGKRERESKIAAFDERMRTRLQTINQIIQARSGPINPSIKSSQSMDQSDDQTNSQPINPSLSNVQRTTISDGSFVILYESHQSMIPIKVKRGAIYQSKFGVFPHNAMIGLAYGSRLYSQTNTNSSPKGGYIDLLSVTPDLWTRSLSHRTQILYFADIALVCLELNLKPGSVVLESGTGSGSLSTALVRCVAPHGYLHTFEFNAARVEKARADFENLGITSNVTVYHRDVCGRGFPLVEGGVDAVFLDLPSPWTVFESAQATIRHGGRIASFSPCIEQVQRACMKLRELGFTDIRTHEVLLEEFDLHDLKMETVPSSGIKTKKQLEQAAKRKSEDSDEQANKRQKTETSHIATKSPTDLFARYPSATRGFALARGHTGYLTFATKVNKV